MRGLLRLLFRLFIFGIVMLIGVMTVKTLTFTSKQISIAPVAPIALDDATVDRLSQAIQLSTISQTNQIDTLAFLQLDTLTQRSFPRIDSLLEKNYINRFSPVFKWQGKNPNLLPVLLLAHLDVVPIEDSTTWEMPPFSGAVKDGFIWGRGTLDDKISAFALLESVEQLLQEDYQPERTLYLAFGHDEESSGRNGALSIANWFKQQNIRFEYILDEGLVILEKALPGLDPPLAMIGVAEKGYTTLKLTVTLPEGGHSSMPPKESTIGILSKAITKLEDQPFPTKIDGASKGLLEHVGPEMSLPFKIIFANLWLTKGMLKWQFSQSPTSYALIHTTTAPTIIKAGVKDNVLPATAEAKVNFRILPGETLETVIAQVRHIIADDRVTVEEDPASFSDNPSKVSKTNPFGFLVIQKSIREIFPKVVVAPALVIGATDSRHYQEVSDNIYRFLPVQITNEDLSRIHGQNERVSVENYKNAIRFYRQLILNSNH